MVNITDFDYCYYEQVVDNCTGVQEYCNATLSVAGETYNCDCLDNATDCYYLVVY
jgi:hypothetical protein